MAEQNNQPEKNSLVKNPPVLNEGNKNTLMAVLSYFGPLVIISYLTAKESSFVKFHIKQGLILLVIWAATWFLGMFLWQLHMLIKIINFLALILAIIGIVNVLQGHEKDLPVVGRFAKHFTF